MVAITIFTPSYNRAHLLNDAYQSLCLQTCKDFEWLIVDDGSTDNTEEVVNGFVQEGKIAVRYNKKINGGKHTAINQGTKLAEGELLWILDSDDTLPENAISTILKCWESLESPLKNDVAGICGYMAHHDGKVIGSPVVETGTLASPIDMRHRLHIVGDMMEVFRTNLLRENPFPEIHNERFCPEDVILNRLSKEYKFYMISDVIYYRDYLDGGLTDNIIKIRMRSPIASMICYSELFEQEIPMKQKIKAAINYWRFAFCAEKRNVKIAKWGFMFAPLGYLMHLNDKRIVK